MTIMTACDMKMNIIIISYDDCIMIKYKLPMHTDVSYRGAHVYDNT